MTVQKGFAPIILLVGILVTVVIAGGAYYLGTLKTNSKVVNPVVTYQVSPFPSASPVKVCNMLCVKGSHCDNGQCVPDQTTSPSADTSGWKTYTNTTYGYSLKYPPSYTVPNQQSDREISQLGKDTQICIIQNVTCIIPIHSIKNTNNFSAEEYIKTQQSLYPIRKQTINSIEWVFWDNTTSPYSSRNYYTIHNGNIYEIDGATSKEDYVILSNQILSSFKFTQ